MTRRPMARMMAAALTTGLLASSLGTAHAQSDLARTSGMITIAQGRTLFARYLRYVQRDEGACLALHPLLSAPLLRSRKVSVVPPAQRADAVRLGRRIMAPCGPAAFLYGPRDPQRMLRREPLPFSVLYLLERLDPRGSAAPWWRLWDSMPLESLYCAHMYGGGFELTGDGDDSHHRLPEGYYATSRGDIWQAARDAHSHFSAAVRSAGQILHVAVPHNW
jgi:hypothetical protein